MFSYLFLFNATVITMLFIMISIIIFYRKDTLRLLFYYIKHSIKYYIGRLTAKENTIILQDNYASVTYILEGESYTIRIPRKRGKFHKMYLIKDNKEIDITQKHGLKYLLSAKDLGGEYIIRKEMDEEVARYHVDEIPN